jgi:hypothetical protein
MTGAIGLQPAVSRGLGRLAAEEEDAALELGDGPVANGGGEFFDGF